MTYSRRGRFCCGNLSDAARIVLETGSLASWLWHELRGRNFPVICLDARAGAALDGEPAMQDRAADQSDPAVKHRPRSCGERRG